MAGKEISGSLGDPGIIKDFTGASASVSVNKSKNAGQTTNVNQSEGKIFTKIQSDISNNSNPGVATQKVVSDISYVGKVSREHIKAGKWNGVSMGGDQNIGTGKHETGSGKSFEKNVNAFIYKHEHKK